jgi:predicted RNA binding protein YcfA (HicA-like mRNA interferase family)
MPAWDLWDELQALRRAGSPPPRDIERIARQAGWVFRRMKGDHAIYKKEGFWANLSIPQGHLKRKTALRLLNVIEASLVEEERASDGDQEGD